jgi:hypothetical protein
MVARDADEDGPGPYYRLLSEGRIQNFDGVTIKSAPALAGLDINRNYPFEWRPEGQQAAAGLIEEEEEEVEAVIAAGGADPGEKVSVTIETAAAGLGASPPKLVRVPLVGGEPADVLIRAEAGVNGPTPTREPLAERPAGPWVEDVLLRRDAVSFTPDAAEDRESVQLETEHWALKAQAWQKKAEALKQKAAAARESGSLSAVEQLEVEAEAIMAQAEVKLCEAKAVQLKKLLVALEEQRPLPGPPNDVLRPAAPTAAALAAPPGVKVPAEAPADLLRKFYFGFGAGGAGGGMAELKLGDKSEIVSLLQQKLNERAHVSPPLDVDGDFGPLTEQAVKDFQQANKLAVDGIVGPQTWNALGVSPKFENYAMAKAVAAAPAIAPAPAVPGLPAKIAAPAVAPPPLVEEKIIRTRIEPVVERLDEVIKRLEADNAKLRQRLDELEQEHAEPN